ARIFAPGQSNAPTQADWQADSYFDRGSGDRYMDASNLSATAVDHVEMTRYEAVIRLDRTVFAPGRYEIEMKRGAQFLRSNWAAATYKHSGTVWDLFGYQGSPAKIPMNRDG